MHCPKFQFGTDDTIYRRDGSAPVPADEPVFILRGKDEVGVLAIREYVRVMLQYPESRLAVEHAASAMAQLQVIEEWQTAHPDRVGMGCHTCEHVDHRERLDLARAVAYADDPW